MLVKQTILSCVIKIILIYNMSADPDLSNYYDKIAQIRSRILSKHKPSNTNKEVDFTFSIHPPNPKSLQPQPPSANEAVNRPNVTSRVRKLEDINDRIKNILGEKKLNKLQSIQKSTQSIFSDNNRSELKQKEQQIKSTYKIAELKPYIDRENPLRKKLFQDQNNSIKNTKTINQANQIQRQEPNQINHEQNYEKQVRVCKNLSQRIGHKKSESIQFIDQANTLIGESKSQTLRLTEVLVKQIQLDSELRQWKQKYDNLKDSSKQEDLWKILQTKGILLTREQLAQFIHISSEQRNPFLDLKTCRDLSLQSFASHIVRCKNHWQTVLKQSLSIQKLQRQYFSIRQIDIQGKGFISVEDLVCYINLNSQKCLRNRDVHSLVRRFQVQQRQCQGKGIISYRAFLNCLTKP